LFDAEPVIRQKKTYTAENQSHVNEIAFVNWWWEMRESIWEFELIHAPGFAQLDVSPAQVFVHIVGEEELVKSSKRENGDLVLRQGLLIHDTWTGECSLPAGEMIWSRTLITMIFISLHYVRQVLFLSLSACFDIYDIDFCARRLSTLSHAEANSTNWKCWNSQVEFVDGWSSVRLIYIYCCSLLELVW